MMNEAERFWDSGAARGWQLIWLLALLVLMKLIAGIIAVDYALNKPFEFMPQSYIVL